MRKIAALFAIASMMFASTASGATIVADWTGHTASTGSGMIDGVAIAASTSTSAEFVGTPNNRFSSGGSGGWNASMPLPSSALSIVAANVNGGDYQQFDFAEPMSGMLYIENFDSSSEATILAYGATSLSLLASSPSISYAPSAADGGVLTSSNPGYNGEGDAVIAFEGPVSSIRLNYSSGVGANGVFYTFAKTVNNPEPTSFGMLLTAALGMLSIARRRQN